MNNLTKEQLEVILKAFKILDEAGTDEKKCIKTVKQEVRDAYCDLVTNGLV